MAAAPLFEKAFILAAGMGKRLRPYTDTMPKPMVPVAGKPTIDHIIDRLVEAGVKDVMVNLHYRGDQIEDHLKNETRLRVHFSHEDSLLDTGGGLKQALDFFGDEPFFIINGDAYWNNGQSGSVFSNLANNWSDETSDLLLLLQDVNNMQLTRGIGDYDFVEGAPVRNKTQAGTHMFAGIRLCHPRLFADTPEGAFPFLSLMDRAEVNGRLQAIAHDGDWHHISTPEELDAVNAALSGTENEGLRVNG